MTEEQKYLDHENVRSYERVDDEINLLDYLLIIAKHIKMITKATACVAVLSVVIALLLPNIYISTARILPPPNSSQGGIPAMLASSGIGDLASLAGISVGGSTGALYVGMLQSRTISDAIIEKFNLMEVYGQEYRSKAYEKLADRVKISLDDEDGIISIAVEDEDPIRAANMANAYVEELKKINVRINLNSAGRERVFLETRLAMVKKDLSGAEDNLKDFQEKNKAIRIEDQAEEILEAIATLKGKVASEEIQLGVLLTRQTEQNPEVKSLREGIAQIKSQLRKLEESQEGENVSRDIFIATADVPELAVQYARLMRNFKVQETLFELLTKQYEVAKINESRNTSILQVLDEGVPSDRKSKPKRSVIVLVATFFAGFLAILLAFAREYLDSLAEEDRGRMKEILTMLCFWKKRKIASRDGV